MSTHSTFWNGIAARYARQPVADEAAYQHKLEVTRKLLAPDMRVLEFGCGTGSTALAHASHAAHIHALDSSSGMIEIARNKASEAGVENVSFECAAIEDLALGPGSVDAVLGMSILHLLDKPWVTVARVHELLTSGGLFFSSTACIGDMGRGFRVMAVVMRYLPVLPTIKVFTTSELIDALTDAGFELEYQWQPGPDKAVFLVARKTG